MDEHAWIPLPQIARELGIPERTARRWAGLVPDLLPSRGSGAARRFHPQARDVLRQAKALFGQGMKREQVAALLRAESGIAGAAAAAEPAAAENADRTPDRQAETTHPSSARPSAPGRPLDAAARVRRAARAAFEAAGGSPDQVPQPRQPSPRSDGAARVNHRAGPAAPSSSGKRSISEEVKTLDQQIAHALQQVVQHRDGAYRHEIETLRKQLAELSATIETIEPRSGRQEVSQDRRLMNKIRKILSERRRKARPGWRRWLP